MRDVCRTVAWPRPPATVQRRANHYPEPTEADVAPARGGPKRTTPLVDASAVILAALKPPIAEDVTIEEREDRPFRWPVQQVREAWDWRRPPVVS
jgi:hypothetical protein